ncbi:hypothetical protein ABK040_009390 [Willaertia magna]
MNTLRPVEGQLVLVLCEDFQPNPLPHFLNDDNKELRSLISKIYSNNDKNNPQQINQRIKSILFPNLPADLNSNNLKELPKKQSKWKSKHVKEQNTNSNKSLKDRQQRFTDYLHTSKKTNFTMYQNGENSHSTKTCSVSGGVAPPVLPSISQRSLLTSPTFGDVEKKSLKPNTLQIGVVVECLETKATVQLVFSNELFVHFHEIRKNIPLTRLVPITTQEYKILLGEKWLSRLIDYENNETYKKETTKTDKSLIANKKKLRLSIEQIKKSKQVKAQEMDQNVKEDFLLSSRYREEWEELANEFLKEERVKKIDQWNSELENYQGLKTFSTSPVIKQRNDTLKQLSEMLSVKMGKLLTPEGNLNSSNSLYSSSSFLTPRTPRSFFALYLSEKILEGKVVYVDPMSNVINVLVQYKETRSILVYLYLDKVKVFNNVQKENSSENYNCYDEICKFLVGKKVYIFIPKVTASPFSSLGAILYSKPNLSKNCEFNTMNTSLPCDMWLVENKRWINKWVVEKGYAYLHLPLSSVDSSSQNNEETSSTSNPHFDHQIKLLKEAEETAQKEERGAWKHKKEVIQNEAEKERIKRWKRRMGTNTNTKEQSCLLRGVDKRQNKHLKF